MSCERCERDIERLRGELNILRSEMIEVVGGMLARVDEVLATVETSNRQMSRTTLAHFSVSSAMSLPKSAGEP
jgi:hypothetical protein